MDQKRKVVPEKVGEALIKAGVIHSAEDAVLIVDLLYELALLFYRQHAHEL